MTAKASRGRSIILFMYQSSFPLGRRIVLKLWVAAA
jgi:hypothetical protein